MMNPRLMQNDGALTPNRGLAGAWGGVGWCGAQQSRLQGCRECPRDGREVWQHHERWGLEWERKCGRSMQEWCKECGSSVIEMCKDGTRALQ